jgi:hypothetical protein
MRVGGAGKLMEAALRPVTIDPAIQQPVWRKSRRRVINATGA